MQINKRNSPLFSRGLSQWNKFVGSYSGPYDFSVSVYAGMNKKIDYICPSHGLMSSDAKNIMRGASCPKCAFEARKGKLRMTQSKMIAQFALAHGDKYDYSQAIYNGQRSHVKIFCKSHGEFLQRPEYHWGGSGCPQCFHEDRRGNSQRDTYESFAAKVQAVFGNLIELPKFKYKNSQQDILVTCSKHKISCETRPNWLVNGCNPCPKCNHMKSAQEDEVARYLSIFTSVVRRDRTLIKPKEIDIWMPEKNLAVEYCGLYWHSHGDRDSEKEGKLNHYNKYIGCASKGVRLLTIYENEWVDRKPAIKRLLRNAVGKSKGKVMARKCQLSNVETKEAAAFFEKYHPQGGAGNGNHYGLHWKGKLVACMRFVFGVNDRGVGVLRMWTLGRYATRVNVVGGASRLFQAFIADKNPSEVKSFSDNRYFSGMMYEQLGFSMEEQTSPDYQVWSPKIGLRPKSHYQRRSIQKRLIDHGLNETYDETRDARTEAEMTYAMGARRIYDCGKKRWVWTNSHCNNVIV